MTVLVGFGAVLLRKNVKIRGEIGLSLAGIAGY